MVLGIFILHRLMQHLPRQASDESELCKRPSEHDIHGMLVYAFYVCLICVSLSHGSVHICDVELHGVSQVGICLQK